MSLRMPGDPAPPKVDAFDLLFCIYQSGSLSVEAVLDILDVSQEDLESAMRKMFPKAGEKLGDSTALVEQFMGLVQPTVCPRCGGTGNIGMLSSVRCPEC